MVNKNLSFRTALILAVIGVSFIPSSTMLSAGIGGVELLDLLLEKDRISNATGYKTSFVMTKNAKLFDPNQGMVFMDCEATWTTEGFFAMKIDCYYEHPPVFATPESRRYKPVDYDKDGNLIVWRPLEKHILFGPNRNDTIEKKRLFFAYPNGGTSDTGDDHITFSHSPIGAVDNIYEFNQYQLATGRGFSQHISTVTSVKSLASGLTKVTSQGSYGRGLKGRWELTLDPNSDYIVKEAIFTRDGADKPRIVVTTSGVMNKDELKMAKYGTFRYSNLLELSVEVTDIFKVVGPNKLYGEVVSHLNAPLAQGSHVIDYRGEKPVITTVK